MSTDERCDDIAQRGAGVGSRPGAYHAWTQGVPLPSGGSPPLGAELEPFGGMWWDAKKKRTFALRVNDRKPLVF